MANFPSPSHRLSFRLSSMQQQQQQQQHLRVWRSVCLKNHFLVTKLALHFDCICAAPLSFSLSSAFHSQEPPLNTSGLARSSFEPHNCIPERPTSCGMPYFGTATPKKKISGFGAEEKRQTVWREDKRVHDSSRRPFFLGFPHVFNSGGRKAFLFSTPLLPVSPFCSCISPTHTSLVVHVAPGSTFFRSWCTAGVTFFFSSLLPLSFCESGR